MPNVPGSASPTPATTQSMSAQTADTDSSAARTRDDEQRVDPRVLEFLICPLTKTQLAFAAETNELISKAAGVAFPIRDGVPLMTAEAARQLDDDAF